MPECRAFKRVPDRAPAFGVRQLAVAFARGTGESATVWLALVDGQRRRVAALQTLPRLRHRNLCPRTVNIFDLSREELLGHSLHADHPVQGQDGH